MTQLPWVFNKYTGVSKNSDIVVPPNHPLKNRVFHDFHHPYNSPDNFRPFLARSLQASSGVLPMDAASDSGTRAPPKGTALGKLGKPPFLSEGNTGNTMGFWGKKNGKRNVSQNFRGFQKNSGSFPSGILIQMFQMEASLQYELPKYSNELKVDMIS